MFNTPSKGIKILGVPLGTSFFTSSCIKYVLLEDVWHVDLLPKMGDVQVNIWNYNSLFHATVIESITMHTSIFHLCIIFYFLWLVLPSNV
jgi:hypothetical protein